MRLYPEVPSRRTRTLVADLVVLALLVLFAWAAWRVHQAIDELAVLGQGVADAGSSLQNGLDQAAGALGNLPIIGDSLANALGQAGQGTGGALVEQGQAGVAAVHQLSWTVAAVVFGLPSLTVLALWLPLRLAQVRRLTAAQQVLDAAPDPERQRLLAMRAAFGLPYATLLEYSRDPLGDLAAGRYQPLVDAALADAGLRPARPGS